MRYDCICTITSHSLILISSDHFLNPFQTPTIMVMILSSALSKPDPNPNILSLPVTNTRHANHINIILPFPLLCLGKAPVCSVPVPEQLSGARENAQPFGTVSLWMCDLKSQRGTQYCPGSCFTFPVYFLSQLQNGYSVPSFPSNSLWTPHPPLTSVPRTRAFSSFLCQGYLTCTRFTPHSPCQLFHTGCGAIHFRVLRDCAPTVPQPLLDFSGQHPKCCNLSCERNKTKTSHLTA